jgi:hypothetical protein
MRKKYFCLFSTLKIKNLKISEESHAILKKYCVKKGLKIHKYLENLILQNCVDKKDVYGEL